MFPGASSLPISVVVTARNDERSLRHALRSVQSQTRAPHDVVFVDTGSTDGSVAVAESLGASVLRREGANAADALNAAIASTSQPWIAVLDPHAVWEPRKLQRQWDAVRSGTVVDLVITDHLRLTADGPPTFAESASYAAIAKRAVAPGIALCASNDLTRFFAGVNIGAQATMLARRSLFECTGGYDAALGAGAELELLLRMALHAQTAAIEEPLTHLGGSTSDATYWWALARAAIAIGERVAKDPRAYAPCTLDACRHARGRIVGTALRKLITRCDTEAASELIAADHTSPHELAGIAVATLETLARNETVRAAHRHVRAARHRARALARRAVNALRRLRPPRGEPIVIPPFPSAPASEPRKVGQDVRLAALTFDDGPDPVTTPLLLAALREAGVPATFFVIGVEAQAHADVCRAVTDAGMELGNHTLTHSRLSMLDVATQSHEIVEGARAIAEAGGAAIHLFRPPYGAFDARTLMAAATARQTIVLWNVDSADWSSADDEHVMRNLTDDARSPAIILLHNGLLSTAALIPRIVRAYRDGGFEFVTVSELVRRVDPRLLSRPAHVTISVASETRPRRRFDGSAA